MDNTAARTSFRTKSPEEQRAIKYAAHLHWEADNAKKSPAVELRSHFPPWNWPSKKDSKLTRQVKTSMMDQKNQQWFQSRWRKTLPTEFATDAGRISEYLKGVIREKLLNCAAACFSNSPKLHNPMEKKQQLTVQLWKRRQRHGGILYICEHGLGNVQTTFWIWT